MKTEAQDAFVAQVVGAMDIPRPYRGGTAVPADAGIISEPPTILEQLKSLSTRLDAITGTAAEDEEPVAESSSIPPWQLRHYESCASFAGEAAKVKASPRVGNLFPFPRI